MTTPATWKNLEYICRNLTTLTPDEIKKNLYRDPTTQYRYDLFKRKLQKKHKTLTEYLYNLCFSSHNTHKLVNNRFPYCLARGIQHYVLWSRKPLSNEIITKMITQRFSDIHYNHLWFENPASIKSVPGIWHVQVFISSKSHSSLN
jgi:hypothetical protein